MKFKGSWKTTAAGITAGLAIILQQVSYMLNDDPLTSLSIPVIVAGFAAMGIGYFSRDNDKSSEDIIRSK